MHAGDPAAAERLLPLVYAELHRVANAYMRRERPDHTLQPTALINEAYLRLIQEDVDWNSREHFVGFAAQVMRGSGRLCASPQRAATQRQTGTSRTAGSARDLSGQTCEQVLLLDEALERLEKTNPRQARVVQECAILSVGSRSSRLEPLLTSHPAGERDWALARIWLFEELKPRDGRPEPQK